MRDRRNTRTHIHAHARHAPCAEPRLKPRHRRRRLTAGARAPACASLWPRQEQIARSIVRAHPQQLRKGRTGRRVGWVRRRETGGAAANGGFESRNGTTHATVRDPGVSAARVLTCRPVLQLPELPLHGLQVADERGALVSELLERGELRLLLLDRCPERTVTGHSVSVGVEGQEFAHGPASKGASNSRQSTAGEGNTKRRRRGPGARKAHL